MRCEGFILITVRFEKEADQWAATCLELGTAACGDTFEEAQDAIREAIGLQLNALEEMGDCQSFFQRHGIKFYRQQPGPCETASRIRVKPGQLIERVLERIPAAARV